MNTYPVNELVQVAVSFVATTGELVDPSTVTLTLTLPDDSVQVIDAITRVDVGKYQYQFVVMEYGLHIYRWQGEGAVIAASPNGFFRGI